MNRALIVILATVTLDAIGIGLIFPILPALLREVGHTTDIATVLGIMLALYSACQFIFSPILGVLSDRFGRRPVLLVSLAGAAIDYVVMAVAPELWMLVIGRAVAGVTSANMAVATAYMTDISNEDERARRFGLFHAMFGIGFIVGPVLGGLLGDIWIRSPFLVAAALNGVNFALALFILPESRTGDRSARFSWDTLNPFRPLAWALTFRALIPLMAIYAIMNLVGTVYGSTWAIFGEDVFAWNGMMIGLSLGAYGLLHAIAQAFLTGPVVSRLGERRALFLGMGSEILAMVVMAVATRGWLVFVIMPIFALGGIGMPALQSLITRQVSSERQGQLQGVLASLVSLASVFGPLMFTFAYHGLRGSWPGAIWLVAMGIYLCAVPLIAGIGRQSKSRVAAP